MLKYAQAERLSLLEHPDYTERWVQDRIAETPGLLGLGDVILKDKERSLPRAGRLDLLFQDPDSTRRYEVELQLGKTDESHIIRTLEYWDLERKRYPQYDHVAVIVAEEITGRFLNVISLFNGFVPIIAIQLQAWKLGEHISLAFTTVMSEVRRGLVDEDEDIVEVADRGYWERMRGKEPLEIADVVLELIKGIDPGFGFKYNKQYIGSEKDGQADNFVTVIPRKNKLNLEARLDKSDDMQKKLDDAGLDVMEYDNRYGRYRIRLSKGDVEKHADLLKDLLKKAYDSR